MKIDMSPQAIALRLEQVNMLRKLCLSLAGSSAGKEIRKRFSTHPSVLKTEQAIGSDERDNPGIYEP